MNEEVSISKTVFNEIITQNLGTSHKQMYDQCWWCTHGHTATNPSVFGENKQTVISRPPYSPDLAPLDILYFQN